LRLLFTVCALAVAACGPTSAPRAAQPPPPQSQAPDAQPASPSEWTITSIDWDDADSGDINGVRFRLSDIDAPETGGVGAAVGAALCERERERGIAARAWIQELTRDPSALRITNSHGYDRMQNARLLIDLSINGVDVGGAGIEAGHLAPWPHDGARALARKPDWCAEQ
jgi:endonuclease YncB( thermonuclease family)